MRASNLPLHVERMARWIEADGVHYQGDDINQQEAARADTSAQHRCRTRSQEMFRASHNQSSKEKAAEYQSGKDEEERQKGDRVAPE